MKVKTNSQIMISWRLLRKGVKPPSHDFNSVRGILIMLWDLLSIVNKRTMSWVQVLAKGVIGITDDEEYLKSMESLKTSLVAPPLGP